MFLPIGLGDLFEKNIYAQIHRPYYYNYYFLIII
jgi:hypothetical protein